MDILVGSRKFVITEFWLHIREEVRWFFKVHFFVSYPKQLSIKIDLKIVSFVGELYEDFVHFRQWRHTLRGRVTNFVTTLKCETERRVKNILICMTAFIDDPFCGFLIFRICRIDCRVVGLLGYWCCCCCCWCCCCACLRLLQEIPWRGAGWGATGSWSFKSCR